MVNVLIISYYFPPEGGPAVQRVARFVKYLPQFGYNPIVLTSKHPIKNLDSELLHDLGTNVNIYRVLDWGAYIPGELTKYIKKRLFPDKQSTWITAAYKQASKIIIKHDIKIVFSSSPPHSVQLISLKLKGKHKLPFVADLRDEWTDNPDFNSWVDKNRQIDAEKSIIKEASFLTTISMGAVKRLESKCNCACIELIYNGFDNDDFLDMSNNELNSKLTFSYGGRLSSHHNPTTFFKALKNMVIEGDISADDIDAYFWGNQDKNKWIKDYSSISNIVHFMPYLNHNDYIKTMAKADVLLLFVTNMESSDMLTGKVYEYMRLKKPILLIIDRKCELNDILNEYGNAHICFTNDIDSICNAIKLLLKNKKEGKLKREIDQVFLSRFDRKNQTEKLTSLFKRILSSDE